MLPTDLPAWMGDIHRLLPHSICGAIVTLAAVLCGAVVGVERGKRQKPAGLRTMMLICLGASIFTQAGLLLAGDRSDPARVAAQVVTGVGFLGAGAIIRGRGTVIGVTTAAAIWVVAAVGVVLGAGYVVAGLFFAALTVAALAAEATIESMLCGSCLWMIVRIRYEDRDGRTRWRIQSVLDEHQVDDQRIQFEPSAGGLGSARLRCCCRHRQHRAVLAELAALPGVASIEEFDAGSGVPSATGRAH